MLNYDQRNSQSQRDIGNLNNSYFNNQVRQHTLENDQKILKQSFQGYGLSLIQSSSTLQKSVQLHSFSKSKRFYQFNDNEDVQYPLLPKTLSDRGTSLGYGQKNIMTKQQQINAEENPGPNVYSKCKFEINEKKGKSFGINHEYYKKQDMPNENPGPGKYKIQQKYPSDKPQIIFKGQKDFQLKKLVTPSPCHYEITHSQVFNKKDSCVALYKNNIDKKKQEITPGPSDYNNLYIPKSFDKFLKKKQLSNSRYTYEQDSQSVDLQK